MDMAGVTVGVVVVVVVVVDTIAHHLHVDLEALVEDILTSAALTGEYSTP